MLPVHSAGVQIDELDAMTLICTLIQGWQDNKRSTRLATAFLKTLNILLARGAINSKSLTGDDADALVELIRNEGRQCSDCLRLCCIADALCHLTVVGKGDTKRALQVRGQLPEYLNAPLCIAHSVTFSSTVVLTTPCR